MRGAFHEQPRGSYGDFWPIALIFNVCVFVYQAYMIFGKKRNPFKQELYIDNPGFRKVYLESIDLPEDQREAALANWRSSATPPHGMKRAA